MKLLNGVLFQGNWINQKINLIYKIQKSGKYLDL